MENTPIFGIHIIGKTVKITDKLTTFCEVTKGHSSDILLALMKHLGHKTQNVLIKEGVDTLEFSGIEYKLRLPPLTPTVAEVEHLIKEALRISAEIPRSSNVFLPTAQLNEQELAMFNKLLGWARRTQGLEFSSSMRTALDADIAESEKLLEARRIAIAETIEEGDEAV